MIDGKIYQYAAIILLPINSAFSPVLYSNVFFSSLKKFVVKQMTLMFDVFLTTRRQMMYIDLYVCAKISCQKTDDVYAIYLVCIKVCRVATKIIASHTRVCTSAAQCFGHGKFIFGISL